MRRLAMVGLLVGMVGFYADAVAGETQHTPVAVMEGNTAHIFVRGVDGQLYEGSLTGGGFSGWSAVPGGGATPSQPGAVLDSSGKLRLYVRGLDNGLWKNVRSGGTWSGWSAAPNGGKTSSGPSVVQDGNSTFLFVRGLDDNVWVILGETVSSTSAESLAGLYTLSVTLTQSGCQFPYGNGTDSVSGTLRLLLHRNQLLGFGPLVTGDLWAIGIGLEIIVNGSQLSGTWHSMNTIDGYASGTLSGIVSGSSLSFSISGSGQNFTCQITGSAIARRFTPLAEPVADQTEPQ